MNVCTNPEKWSFLGGVFCGAYSAVEYWILSFLRRICLRCQEFLDRRKMTEWGSLSLVDEGEADVAGKSISLPGVRSGDLSSRHWKPEVRVTCVQFSPTGNYNVVVLMS